MSTSSSAERRRRFQERLKPFFLRYLPGIALLCVLLADSLLSLDIAPLHHLEAVLYDARVRYFAPGGIDERIAIVDIDERSLAEFGRWPWHRARLAELVEGICGRHGAVLLGLDVILAEADTSSGLAALDALARGPLRENAGFQAALGALRPGLDYDARLAAAIGRYPVVLGFHFSDGPQAANAGALPPPTVLAGDPGERIAGLPDWSGHAANLPRLQQAATGAGFLGAPVDADGVTRRAWLLARHQGQVYTSLPLAMAQILLGNPRLVAHFSEPAAWRSAVSVLDELELSTSRGSLHIAVDRQAGVLLPFRGPERSYRYYSAADVLAGRLPADSLRGRVVLLGTTAPGLLDQRATPVGEAYPGVEAHANLLSALLDGKLLRASPTRPEFEAALLLVFGVALLVTMPRVSPGSGAILALAAAGLLTMVNLLAWSLTGCVLPLASGLTMIGLLFGLHVFTSYFIERRAKRRLTRLFGQYVPPELVEEMSRDPQHYTMEGRSAELTVLFADVRGFTALAETMPPAELAHLMNDYFSRITDVIRRHRGTLDKYVGDAVLAFWGAPLADTQHALHAVQAACDMQSALQGLNQRFVARGWPALQVGIGINTGTMVVGDMGSRHRRAYTVLGDAVNIASRFQGLSAHFAASILIGEATRQALGDWPCRLLARVTVRGRSTPVAIYEPTMPTSDFAPKASK